MRTEEWPSSDWGFLSRLEVRSSQLATPQDRAAALQLAAPRIPSRSAWKAWAHLVILTVAGLHLGWRSTRVQLAKQTCQVLNESELATLCVDELERGATPAYLRHLLANAYPGQLWSRLRYPLRCYTGGEGPFPVGSLVDDLASAVLAARRPDREAQHPGGRRGRLAAAAV